MKKKLMLTGIVIGIIATGYFREFVFVNLNEHLRFLYYENDTNYAHNFIQSIGAHFSYIQLYYAKWGLTVLFALVFLGWTCLAINLLFKQKKFLSISIGAYVLLFFLAGVFYTVGNLTGNGEAGYKFARIFMGIAQSPIPAMLLVPAFLLATSGKKDEASH